MQNPVCKLEKEETLLLKVGVWLGDLRGYGEAK